MVTVVLSMTRWSCPGIDYTLHIDTASPSSTYEIYFLAADHASPPNEMDTVYVGDSVTVAWTPADIDSIRISLFDFKDGDWTAISGG
jgi:hypothetical protein